MNNYLGLDWGAVNIGVALAYEETRIAFAHVVLPNNRMLLQHLGDIIRAENIGTAVIGMPHYIHHTQKAHPFPGKQLGDQLERHYGITVVYAPEMFTTQTAQGNLRERGEKNVSKQDDAEAARIVLQEWLDTRRS